jgi:hypothetical protein
MYKNYEDDMIFRIISDHSIETGNLDPDSITKKIAESGITIGLSSLQSRIDEFKKIKAYKDGTSSSNNL